MSKPSSFFKSAATGCLLFGLCGSCSSIPEFHPQKPVEQAQTFEEAVGFCDAYRIKIPKPLPNEGIFRASPNALIPWLRCHEKIFLKKKESHGHPDYVSFYRSLQATFDSFSDKDALTIDAVAMNEAVAAAIQTILNPTKKIDDREIQKISMQLPGFGFYLSSLGEKPEDSEALFLKTKARIEMSDLSQNQKALCTNWLYQRLDESNLRKLLVYQNHSDPMHEGLQLKRRIESLQERLKKRLQTILKLVNQMPKRAPVFSEKNCPRA